jgi:hypothetical protein
VTGHLYVAYGIQQSSETNVLRFPIVRGIPKPSPDLTYPGVGYPIAVDTSGDLYASAGNFSQTIDVFGYGSVAPARTLTLELPQAALLVAVSLYVSPRNYLFVGYSASFNGSLPPESGVLVYPPGARGKRRPLQRIVITAQPSEYGVVGGLTMDARGDLLAAESSIGSAVYTFALPVKSPKLIRTLSGPDLPGPNGLVIDASGELYVNNSQEQSYIAAYPATASGTPPPDREISFSGGGEYGMGLTTSAGILFVPNWSGDDVVEIYSAIGGVQMPISTLSGIPNPMDVKLGR